MGKRKENGGKSDYYFLIETSCDRSARSPSNRRFKKFSAWRNSVPTRCIVNEGTKNLQAENFFRASLHGERAELAQNK